MSKDVGDRARSLIGSRFRAQGRDPELGVDCLGLAMLAFGVEASAIRRDYRLGGDHKRELMAGLSPRFRRVARTQLRAGDLMLVRIADRQFHLAVRTEAGFVHADVRRGVVETPGMPVWPIIGTYRLRAKTKRSDA